MRNFFENIWLKLLALLLGFLVWLHVATEKPYTYELRLPVTEVALKERLVLADPPPDSILVAVSATGKQLLRQSWRRNGLRINATQFQAGTHTVSLSTANTFLIGPSGNVTLDEIMSPTMVQLSVDAVGRERVPVTANVDAVADEGYAVSHRVDITPSRVALIGPKSAMTDIPYVLTERKELRGLRNNVTLRLAVQQPNQYGFDVDPDSVAVAIQVVPVKTRIYNNLPIAIFHAPPNEPVSTQPSTIRVELTGPPEDIDLLNANNLTVSVDYRNVSISGYARLTVDCPPSFKVKATSVDSVKVILPGHADTRN